MTIPRFNISAAYDLAESAMAIIIGEEEEIYLEDYVGVDSDDFWLRAQSPQRNTILHTFLEGWEHSRWEQCMKIIPPSEDFGLFERFIENCDLEKPAWFTIENIDDHTDDLENILSLAIPKAANAAFQLLFQDRRFLLKFHTLVARKISEVSPESLPKVAALPVSRCSYIPAWLKKGIYHRDRGLCQNCGRDVSGQLNLEGEIHLDHLLPLHAGGTNDSSNFQVLCKECNLTKGGSAVTVSNINHAFW